MFLVVPLCLIIGYLLGIKLVGMIVFPLDLRGKVFVSFTLIPMYVIASVTVRKKLKKMQTQEQSTNGTIEKINT